MRSSLLLFVLGAAFLGLAGCKNVGAVCDQSGSTSGCADGKICTFVSSPGETGFDEGQTLPPVNVCLRTCQTSTDCGEAETCRFVYCSTQLSCQTGPVQDPTPNLCGTGGAGGAGGEGGAGGDGGTGGDGGMGGVAGTGGTGGNQNCDSTAVAFIKTLDPDADFNLTNLVEEDTTDLPDTWARYSIELPIDAGLEGQLLQVGFAATASNYASSGVFYDNIIVDPGAQYTQDFESLDQPSPTALSDDGWIVFGNAFEADGETFAYGYGPNPAPNPGEGFCAIATSQGGVDQGANQLSIYSDYANLDQAIGRRIEANTFQERTITAGDVGTTIIFNFDAKRGNINEGCP
ncbi:MAG: hypothetical protein ACN4G0_10930 [Polyangiales bacterium]